jgi:hypothetical protein
MPVRQPARLVTFTLCTVLACVTSATVSAAATATKTVVRIDLKGEPQGGNPSGGGGTFTLSSGAIADHGSSSYSFFTSGATLKGTITLDGKKGSLTLSTTSRPSGLSVDSQGLDLWVGNWKVIGATGAYQGTDALGAYVGIIGPAMRLRSTSKAFEPADAVHKKRCQTPFPVSDTFRTAVR